MVKGRLSRVVAALLAILIVLGLWVNVPSNYEDMAIIANAATNVSNLNPVDSTYAFIKSVEGYSPECFWDVAQWTIGYGNKCPYTHTSNGVRGQKGGHTISEAQARELFSTKLSGYVSILKSNCSGLSMTQNQFDALLSATYNHGNVNSCPLKYYLQGKYTESEAREKYYVWCINPGTADENGLRNRRKKEANLFFSDVSPEPTPSLATPTISTDKSSYNVGDTVCLSWAASPAGSNLSHYWLNVIAPDGTYVYGGTMNKVTSYSFVALQSGNYSVTTYATPIGSKEGEGSLTDTKKIAVNNATCIVKFVDYPTNYESNKTVVVGNAYGTLPTLTRAGYTFCGWYRGSNEITASTIVSDASDHSLYAQWKVADNAPDYPIASYYADLNFDGSYSVFDISIIRDIENGNKIPTVIEKIYADLNGDGFVDQKDVDVISRIYLYGMDDGEVRTAFNKWKTRYLDTVYYLIPLDTEYVDFFSISIKQGHQYGTLPTASREGYTFDGWYADGITLINSKSIFTIEDYPISIGGSPNDYCGIDAHWTAKKYIVTFDAQGGSCSTTSRTVQYDSTYGSLPTPTRQGYSFNGWYDSNDVAIISSTVYKTASNQVLYAHWTANSYTVSFDSNGGSCSETKRTVLAGETYGMLPEPTRTGYDFDGWYTEKDGGSKVTADTEVSKLASVTLYAHWTAKSYCIVFHVDEDIPSVRLVSYHSSYGTLEDPAEWGYTKNGYVFDGWYTEEIGGSKVTANTLAIEDKDLYAHWRINSCTVTFDPQGGECGLDKKNVTYGESYGTLPTVWKVGYNLDGWYTKKVGGSKINSYTEVFELNSENLTLYAHWTEKSYRITFHVDKAILSERLVSYRSPYGILEDPAEWGYIKDGYEFDGWYTTETGGLKVTSNTLATGDCDLYARWKKIETTEASVDLVSLYGDVDCDGDADIMDVILLNRNLMIGAEISEQGLLNADVDNSGEADAVDSLNILKAVVKLITLPV